jgi:hypothetical protein
MAVINSGDVPINETQVDGTELARRLERLYAAFHSQNSSEIRPPFATAGAVWSKPIQAGGYELYFYDGSKDTKVASVKDGLLTLSSSALTSTSLTAGRVTYAGVGGVLKDSANLRFDDNNLGLGVVPSLWGGCKAFDLSLVGAIYADGATVDYSVGVALNAYRLADGSFKYKTSNPASLYKQSYGVHSWHVAPTGTQGNIANFVQAMTMSNDGRLYIGTTSNTTNNAKLTVAGGIAALGGASFNGSCGYTFVGADGDSDGGLFSPADGILVLATNGSEIFRAKSSRQFFFGTASEPLQGANFIAKNISSTTEWSFGANSGGSYIVYNQGGTGVYLPNGGTSWLANSDERLKTKLTPFEKAVEKICSLRSGVGRYLSDDDTVSRSFLIAQDVQKILPEAVHTQDDGTLGLQYDGLIPLLVAGIKEQQEVIKNLEARLAKVEGE